MPLIINLILHFIVQYLKVEERFKVLGNLIMNIFYVYRSHSGERPRLYNKIWFIKRERQIKDPL